MSSLVGKLFNKVMSVRDLEMASLVSPGGMSRNAECVPAADTSKSDVWKLMCES